MKRLIVWVLLAAMFCAGFAVADEKPYAWVIPGSQSGNPSYSGLTAITPETYPKVTLTLWPTTSDYLVFDPPAGAVLVDISIRSAKYQKPAENGYSASILYSISADYEGPKNFQEKESAKKILSVTETTTTFVDKWGAMRGYIALPEFGKNISLDIRVDGENEEEVLEEEMARLQSSAIHEESIAPYWSYGAFKGVKLTDFMDTDYTLRFDFPTLAELGAYGERLDFVMTDLSETGKLQGYYFLDSGERINITVNLSASEPFIYRKDDAYDVETGGAVWKVRGDLNTQKTEEIFRAFELVRCLPKAKDGKERYLEVAIANSSWDAFAWTRSSISRIAELLEGKIAVINASDNPYVSAAAAEAAKLAEEEAARAAEEAARAADEAAKLAEEEAARAAEEAARAADEAAKLAEEEAARVAEEAARAADEAEKQAAGDTWVCPDCGHEGNDGNFCKNCGTKRPEPEPAPDPIWTCAECGQEGNDGNFCKNCGAKRPDPVWTCPDCGHEGNDGNFCSNCGKQRP